jgi:mono/diheme cytochrome c family protein
LPYGSGWSRLKLLARCSAAAIAVTAAVAGGAAFAQTFRPLDLSGAELFDRYCAACHGSEGRGDGPVAESLNRRVPDLTRLARDAGGEFPALRVRETIDGRAMVMAHGTRRMPVWGYEFWVEEGADVVAEDTARQIIDRILAYVESIQTAPDPGAVR